MKVRTGVWCGDQVGGKRERVSTEKDDCNWAGHLGVVWKPKSVEISWTL